MKIQRWIGRVGRNPPWLSRDDPQCPQRVQDDSHVYDFLQQGALNGRQISQCRGDHPSDRQPDAGHDTLQGDPAGTLSHFDPRQQAIQVIDQKNDIRCLGRGRSAPCSHGNADVGSGKGWGIVDAVTHHHDRAILALGQD